MLGWQIIHETKSIWKCAEKWPLVIILTITSEPWGILRWVLNALESRHYGLELEHVFTILSTKIKRVIAVWIWPIEYYPKFGVQQCADRSAEK